MVGPHRQALGLALVFKAFAVTLLATARRLPADRDRPSPYHPCPPILKADRHPRVVPALTFPVCAPGASQPTLQPREPPGPNRFARNNENCARAGASGVTPTSLPRRKRAVLRTPYPSCIPTRVAPVPGGGITIPQAVKLESSTPFPRGLVAVGTTNTSTIVQLIRLPDVALGLHRLARSVSGTRGRRDWEPRTRMLQGMTRPAFRTALARVVHQDADFAVAEDVIWLI